MLKMIIADDEPIITKGIQMLIDWHGLGIDIVGEYADGAAALHGIFSMNPDIALLDISMPNKTGIDIIKEIHSLGLKTQVIFISGFQEFGYVKEALSKGAVDYLLKPIKKDELLKTIEICVNHCISSGKVAQSMVGTGESTQLNNGLPQEVVNELAQCEVTTYRPVVFELLESNKRSATEEKLIRFSMASQIEHSIKSYHMGIAFTKNEKLTAVFKGKELEDILLFVRMNIDEFEAKTKNRMGAIIGEEVTTMSEIPSAYDDCIDMKRYLFFERLLSLPIVKVGQPVYRRHYTLDQLVEQRRRTIDSLFAIEEEHWLTEFAQYTEIIGVLSDGRKEDAWFYYNATVRLIEERFESMNINTGILAMNDILEKGRATCNYQEMSELYKALFNTSRNSIRETMLSHEKKDIISAKKYIDEHYMDNLSLEVLAGYIHMNSYYFSSFFKKQTGENFKDYLNKVRMEHSLRLLLSTDKKSFEIADEVGFKDEKYFSKLFQKYYGDTPTQYRKKRY